ncbi:MAG: 23S rRNA (guanosine(2251)-2'-O)-methyltransferase RlmB [Campylobacteraceae bacterium]|nr:23S rRNA (guanosine(2251)-2'-O)-methyltransferase RlmB [Campylobacteraceae bacterium]
MIIYGKQLLFHLIDSHKEKINKIYLAKEVDTPTFNKISRVGVKIEKLDFKKAQAMARGGNHQGFLAEVDEFEFASLDELKKGSFLAILYGLSDVGNIGAITRTAYALGVDGLIVVTKSLAIEGIIRSSSGAAYELPICVVEDGLSLLNELKQTGFTLYAAASGGADVSKAKFAEKKALIMGSEGEGIPNRALKKCDENIGIKMKRSFDSLNVSVAFGIICDRMVNG